jgi:hypothetical protein
MPADILYIDDNGRNTLGAVDDSTNEVRVIQADGTSKSLRVNNWVWNTGTLAWERMKQPALELTGDLTVSMGDVERLLADNYWKIKQYDYTSGNLDYSGFNISASAADADVTWYVWKYTWVGANCTKIQGPAVGSWTGRAILF